MPVAGAWIGQKPSARNSGDTCAKPGAGGQRFCSLPVPQGIGCCRNADHPVRRNRHGFRSEGKGKRGSARSSSTPAIAVGAIAGRCVIRGKGVELEELPAYCAVAVAGVGDLPDTIITRSVVIAMRKRAPNEAIEPYRPRLHAAAGNKLRDTLSNWAANRTFGEPWPTMPESVTDRNADVWEPLLAIADAAGGDWPERSRVASVALVALAMWKTPSLGVRLLADIRTVFGDRDSMPTELLLEDLWKLDESPWSDIRGKPIKARGIANLLRKFGVEPRVIRVGPLTPRGYLREDLHDAWIRYLTPLGRCSAGNCCSSTI